MKKKIVIVGPPEVGKTTLRKIFFEGENSAKLLNFALEPTQGQETILVNMGEETKLKTTGYSSNVVSLK